jgi:fructose-bisphosphate aldolase, class I
MMIHDKSFELMDNAEKLCQKGKGILAADESTGTIGKRLAQINVENHLENRTRYRELLFSTPDLNKYISGVITYEETLLDDNLRKLLKDQDIVIGIKVDKGIKELAGTDDETVTQGLDDLDIRCKKYYDLGARFAKWRGVLKIDLKNSCPSTLAINQCAETLARYASICQINGLVPIVEPEILMDGDHDIEQCCLITDKVISTVYMKLREHNVLLEGTLLKPNMVRKGQSNKSEFCPASIAYYTITALKRSVPIAVPGIMFLSGGMSEQDASDTLNEINKFVNSTDKIWNLSFSFGRALQYSVLQTWKGLDENIEKAQKVLLSRAKANSDATLGKYNKDNDNGDPNNLHIKNYLY